MLPIHRAQRYISAGYTHYAMYEVWLPICESWTESGFPFIDDGNHREALKVRARRGEIRNVIILEVANLAYD